MLHNCEQHWSALGVNTCGRYPSAVTTISFSYNAAGDAPVGGQVSWAQSVISSSEHDAQTTAGTFDIVKLHAMIIIT